MKVGRSTLAPQAMYVMTLVSLKTIMKLRIENFKVDGSDEVELKFTLCNIVILKEVLHIPEIRKNLVIGYLLNKVDFT